MILAFPYANIDYNICSDIDAQAVEYDGGMGDVVSSIVDESRRIPNV